MDIRERCIWEWGVEGDFFMYEGEKFQVNFTMTNNANLLNEGTPFVVGDLVENKTDHLRVKTFLVKEWLDK